MHRPFLVALAVVAGLAPAAQARSVEVFSPDGSIARVDLELPASAPLAPAEAAALEASAVTPIQQAGRSSNRLDIVFLGDGYTADEQELFHEHARAKWLAIRDTEPFKEYAQYFNVWMVDVVSPESGVDNDPRPPTMRDTALDMGFYCQGTERALCVDEAKALAAAEAAPAADQIVVLANSTKYGGVGGTVATSSGGSAAASLITVHELGHSLGGLADEYDYYYRAGVSEDSTQDVTIPLPYLVYPEPALGEPDGPNITAAGTAEELLTGELKWWRWVGEESPDGGPVGAYEGAGYYRYGLYRPTQDSLMHTLGILDGGNEFNSPSSEQLVMQFYEKLDPIDAVTRTASALRVRPLEPATHPLDIRWSLDGVEQTALRGSTTFPLDESVHGTVTVTVYDATAFVRDPEFQAKDLTQSRSWTV